MQFCPGSGTDATSTSLGLRLGRPAIGLAAFLLCAVVASSAQRASEYEVKAAYLYNFAKYTTWPEQSLPDGPSPLVIGVVGDDNEFLDILNKTVAGRSVGRHPLAVKRINESTDLKSCQLIFFLSSAGRKRTQTVLSNVASSSVLVVGEEGGFLQQGGMINLVLANGTVRFEVNRTGLDRVNLHLSQELLALSLARPGELQTVTSESRKLKVSSAPEYPDLAQRMNIKGAVQLEVSVARDGTVKDVRVIGGHPMLADASVKAVRGWQYEPADKESRIVVRFVFGQ